MSRRPATGGHLARALSLVQRTPRPVLDAVAALGGWEQAWLPTAGVQQWQRTVTTMTGVRPGRAATARAVRSWARNLSESAQLSSWTPQRIVERVEISPEHRELLLSCHRETGAVVALPHLGSWDHAGAWACLEGMPVSSVAEQLPPADFDFFAVARSALGMRIYPHRDPRVIERLIDDSRAGRLVCLLADRNFSRNGVEVDWPTARGPRQVRMPGGPVQVALATGAALLPATTYYTGRRLHIDIWEPVTAPAGPGQVGEMCQRLADVFAREIARRPYDWHVLQPFFVEDLPERYRRPSSGEGV